MAASIESRVPFMDYRIVEFANRLPSAFKVRNGSGKAIVKDVAREDFGRAGSRVFGGFDALDFGGGAGALDSGGGGGAAGGAGGLAAGGSLGAGELFLGQLLLLGLWEPLQFIHLVQLTGTAAMVLFGYCPLARAMSLLPWNRHEPLSAALIWRTIAELPRIGAVHHGLGDRELEQQATPPWTCDSPNQWPTPKPKTHPS